MFNESDIVLSAKHIVKQFPASGGRTLTACNDVNLNVYKGKTLGIVGESGCGKSIFVRMVISLEQTDERRNPLPWKKSLQSLQKRNLAEAVRICRWSSRIRWRPLTRK